MRIIYVSLSYIPSRRASSVQVMRMCSALSRRGHDLTLLAKHYDEPTAAGSDAHAFYGVPPTFELDAISRPKWRGGGMVYVAGVTRRLLAERTTADLVYSRDLTGAAIATELGMPVVLEVHGIVHVPWQRALWRRIVRGKNFRGLVPVSDALARQLRAADLVPPDAPTLVVRNATDAQIEGAPRGELGSPPRIGYVGNLYETRGVEILVDLARRLPGCQFEIVGGSERDLARWRARDLPRNLVLHGFQPPSALPGFYRAFDIVLMPYPKGPIYGEHAGVDGSSFCCPLKMFEYMASGVPMIASDLPVLQEVLEDGRNALIAPAEDAPAWQAAIERLLGSRELRVDMATRALAELRASYTPAARAARVMHGLGLEPVPATAAAS